MLNFNNEFCFNLSCSFDLARNFLPLSLTESGLWLTWWKSRTHSWDARPLGLLTTLGSHGPPGPLVLCTVIFIWPFVHTCVNIFQWFWETFIERYRFSTYYFEKDFTEIFDFNKTKLANSANTKCRPFQVKINCPKFIINGLQQRCHMPFSVSLFVTPRNLLFGVFKEIYQTGVTERCTFLIKRSGISAIFFDSTWEKINL